MTRTLVCCVLLGFSLPSMAAEPAMFRFSKQVDRGAAGGECILGVALDPDVYASTRSGYPDLRIFDAAGKEVPYLVEKEVESRTHIVRRTCGSRVVSLHEQEGGLEVIVRLDDLAPAADGLSIITPLTDYERRVRVFGSNDGAQWTPLITDGLLFDYSRYLDVSNHEIRFQKNHFRQFKINIADITDVQESPLFELTRRYRDGREAEQIERTLRQRRPFRMDHLEFWGETSETLFESDLQIAYPVVKYQVREDAAEKRTIVTVTTRREPLGELALVTSSRNFSRQAVVQTPVQHGMRTEWVEVGRARIFLLDLGSYHRRELTLPFPSSVKPSTAS